MIAISLAAELLLMTAIGIFIRKINLVQDTFTSQVSAFLMNVALPCLVFTSMTAMAFSMELLANCGIVLLLSVVVCGIQFLLGQLVYRLTGKSGSGRLMRYGMLMPHFSFMGIPVVNALFGDLGNMYYAIFLIPVRIIYYGASKTLLQAPQAGDAPQKSGSIWKSILSPALVVIPIALLFWVTGWKLPGPVMNCVSSLSKICSSLALILCGTALGRHEFKKLGRLRYWKLPLVRTIVMPAIFILLTRVLSLFGIDELIGQMIVVYTALPIASLMATFVMQYDPDPEMQFEAAGNTMIATLLSTVTLPVWYMILQKML